MRTDPRATFLAALVAFFTSHVAAEADSRWYKPNATAINNLKEIIDGQGVWGYIYDTSETPDEKYGIYNWCNMPHVRPREYKPAPSEYKLRYVELIQRHHKRTVYASNAFPVESYNWDCDDQALFFYAQPGVGRKPARVYWRQYDSPINPYKQNGFRGSCQFPQITIGGLQDSWQHGQDLYAVYHDLLGFLPDNAGDKVTFRVSNNIITSQVAGSLINGFLGTEGDFPVKIQPNGQDSLAPQYSCPRSSNLFNSIRSGDNWTEHLIAARPLYAALDNISGVSPNDGGWHETLDHYYDNLSARQCHALPLPCKLLNGANSTTCVNQDLADQVYRLGHYEYSYMYRDDPRSLPASAASLGVWISELADNIRKVLSGESDIIYRHNVAHDGSMSRLLSILQLDHMVWPGMGAEVVFEVYKKAKSTPTPTTLIPATSSSPYPSPTALTSESGNYIRVLWNGQVLKSSNPGLGLMDLIPIETLLDYFEGLVGKDASRVRELCDN